MNYMQHSFKLAAGSTRAEGGAQFRAVALLHKVVEV